MAKRSYLVQPTFQLGELLGFDDQRLIIEILNDEVVVFRINLYDDSFDGFVTLDKDTFKPRHEHGTTKE